MNLGSFQGLLSNFIYCMRMSVYLSVCDYSALEGQKRALEVLELEL